MPWYDSPSRDRRANGHGIPGFDTIIATTVAELVELCLIVEAVSTLTAQVAAIARLARDGRTKPEIGISSS